MRPARVARAIAMKPEAASSPAHHILVIDDEAPIQGLLRSYFRKHGYLVTVAGSAREAWRLIQEGNFDLAVLDVVLPDTDGLNLLSTIRRAYPGLPIIIMTGLGFDEETLREAMQKGASGYVSKALSLEHLLMEVRRNLHSRPPNKTNPQ